MVFVFANRGVLNEKFKFLEVVGSRVEETGENVLELLQNKENYPVNLRFGIQKLTSNDKIIMASTFHTVFAFACQVKTQFYIALILIPSKMMNVCPNRGP